MPPTAYTKETKKLWKVHEVAVLLNIQPPTVYSWSEQGKIPCYKLNGALRFDEEEIREFVKRSRVEKSYNTIAGRKTRKGG